METRDDILKELQQIAPKLSAFSKVNFYTVPAGYFNELKLSLYKIPIENSLQTGLLSAIEKPAVSVKDVPEGYFNTFAVNMLQKIKQDELAEIAPALAGLQKVNLYTVPEGYFNAPLAELVEKVMAKDSQSIAEPKWLRKLNGVLDEMAAIIFKPRYAAAFAGIAAVIIIISLSLFKPQPLCTDAMCELEQGLAGISDQEILMYINDNTHDFDAAMVTEQMDDEALNKVDVNDTDFDKQLDEFIQSEFDDKDLKELM